jgi:hypothetical protein
MASTIHLLPDEPTTQDEFGTHSRVATAVAELIATEKTGKAIAVIGAWGSGKSSVVQMVRARLAGVADVFVFDAWTHEGDPLRRTFLETLINFLWPENRSADIKALWDEVTLRKKTKEETTAPVLTWEARALGILLLMVPAGLAMFAAMVRMKEPSWTLVTIALVLSLLPLIFVVVLGLGVSLRKIAAAASRLPRKITIGLTMIGSIALAAVAFLYRIPLAEHTKPRLIVLVVPVFLVIVFAIYRSSTSGVLPLLLSRIVTTTRSESIESGDPSSIEFQRWFQSLVAMHYKSKGRRLVIAIDNLDRVDSSLARQLWATMRTFFEFTSEARPEEERIWLLAAFDKGAIQSLWDVDDPDSFIKKTFQASFYVPSLVLIHRDDYLKKQLRAAFPFCGDGLLDPVVRLYALKHATEIFTPRNITSFVNAVGSIHRQWRLDEIALINQAQYVLAAENNADVMSILNSAATASWSPEELVGPNWQESLAAIHFNVPPRDVAHVFMPPVITDGLISGDVTKFGSLAKVRGFGGVLSEVVLRNKEAWKQPQNLANAVSALDSLRANENDDDINRTWRMLTTAASRVEKWDPVAQTGTALSILIRRSANDNGQITKLLKSAGLAIPRTASGSVDNSEEGLTRFVKALAPVIDLLLALPPSFAMIIYGSAVTYLNLLAVLQRTKSEQFAAIGCRLDTESRDEIPRILGDLIKTVQLKDNFPSLIKCLSAHYAGMDWQPIIDAAKYLFANTNNNFLQSGFKTTFEMLLTLASCNEAAAQSLEDLAQNGTLYHYAGVAKDGQSKDLAFLMILLFSDASEATAWPGEARRGISVFKEWLDKPDLASVGAIASLVVAFGLVARLQSQKALSDSLDKALAAMIRLVAERSEISRRLNEPTRG